MLADAAARWSKVVKSGPQPFCARPSPRDFSGWRFVLRGSRRFEGLSIMNAGGAEQRKTMVQRSRARRTWRKLQGVSSNASLSLVMQTTQPTEGTLWFGRASHPCVKLSGTSHPVLGREKSPSLHWRTLASTRRRRSGDPSKPPLLLLRVLRSEDCCACSMSSVRVVRATAVHAVNEH